MKSIEYYRNVGEYPKKPSRPQINTLKATSPEVMAYGTALEQYEKDMVVYQEKMDVYRKRDIELQEEFQRDLIEENALTGHPKADLLYSKAWDHGHANGYEEVLYWFNDLAELIR